MRQLDTTLVVDPQPTLADPYQFVPTTHTVHVTSTAQAAQYLVDQLPDLVMVSASFSPAMMLEFLGKLKQAAADHQGLPPLIVMVNLKNRLNFVPGTTWANKLGLLNSLSSQAEVELVVNRVCTPTPSLGYH